MQRLQYLFYSLLSIQEHTRVCVKRHQNYLQTSKTIPRPPVLKFLDPPLMSVLNVSENLNNNGLNVSGNLDLPYLYSIQLLNKGPATH